MMKTPKWAAFRPMAIALAASIGLGASLPAFADSEIEMLKKELAAQRALIEQLLAERKAEKAEKAAAPAAGARQVASAGSNAPTVSFYGVLDGGVEHISGIGADKSSVTRLPSITGTVASRVGVKASKEFAPGYKVIATAEAGFNLDDGTQGQAGRLFGRQLWAGLDTPYGSFTFGRQYSMLLGALGVSDFLGPNIYALGSLDSYLPNARFDNSVAWRTKLDKVSLGLTYSTGRDTAGGAPASGTCAGETVGDAQACRGWSAMVRYDDERFAFGAGIDEQRGGGGAKAYFFNGAAPVDFSRSGDTDTRMTIGGSVKIAGGKVGAGWLGRKLDSQANDIESNIYYINGAWPVMPKLTVDGGIYRVTNDDQDRDATLWVLRGLYALDTSLTAYLQLGHITNSDKAAYQVSVGAGIAPAAGNSQTATMVGLRYMF